MISPEALPVESLSYTCDARTLGFDTTQSITPYEGVIGQPRAMDAIRFGMGIPHPGYNLFLLGRPGVGKETAVRHVLEEMGDATHELFDWCYVNNFQDQTRPRLLQFAQGEGGPFCEDMKNLVEDLRSAIPNTFQGESYQHSVQEIDEEYEKLEEDTLADLTQRSEQQGIRLIQRKGQFTFAPLKDGKTIEINEFQRLPEEERKRIEQTSDTLQAELESILTITIPQWRRERQDRIMQLNRQFTTRAVGHFINGLKQHYRNYDAVIAYLDAVEQDVVEHVAVFRAAAENGLEGDDEKDFDGAFQRYQVNLFIDNSKTEQAPVVYEDKPSFQALFGRIEHEAQYGTLITNFTLLKPGALHRANGGYLLLDAHKLLTQPFAWEGLKRVLYSREVKMESLGQTLSLISTVSLEPEPIPVNLKIVLMGDRMLYYMLAEFDPEFSELFKVEADFDETIDRSPENLQLLGQVVAMLVRKLSLKHLTARAVAAVIERSARLAAEDEKFSSRMCTIEDLLVEAHYWASQRATDLIDAEDIERAIKAQISRQDRVRDRLYENIQKGIVSIATGGAVVGQVNGLSVLEVGQFAFGVPVRITASTRLGEGEVVDIEREVEMGGPIHSKGIFILSAFLGARYASRQPLSLSASLTFEQSYSEVEGDSASLAELCALLSSLAEMPINQGMALTGSVDQLGNVQAIGAVNEKIEGFFAVCRQAGLTGGQAVAIPATNTGHLMLSAEVRAAVRDGQFAVYPVKHVDEAMALLTGLPVGEADEKGIYPEDSVNGRVQAKLLELAQLRQAFSGEGKPAGPVAE